MTSTSCDDLRADISRLSDELYGAEQRLAALEKEEARKLAASFQGAMRCGMWTLQLVDFGPKLVFPTADAEVLQGKMFKAFNHQDPEDGVRYIFRFNQVEVVPLDEHPPVKTLAQFVAKHGLDVSAAPAFTEYKEGLLAKAETLKEEAEAVDFLASAGEVAYTIKTALGVPSDTIILDDRQPALEEDEDG